MILSPLCDDGTARHAAYLALACTSAPNFVFCCLLACAEQTCMEGVLGERSGVCHAVSELEATALRTGTKKKHNHGRRRNGESNHCNAQKTEPL